MSKVKQLSINGTTYDLDVKAGNLYTDTTIRDLFDVSFYSEQNLGAWSIPYNYVSSFSNMPTAEAGTLYVLYPDSNEGYITLIYVAVNPSGNGGVGGIYKADGSTGQIYEWHRIDAGGLSNLSITVGGTTTTYDGSSAESVTLGNTAKLNYTFDSSTKTLTFTT